MHGPPQYLGGAFNRLKRMIPMNAKTENLLETLRLQPVVPVIVIENAKSAVPLARALVKGGLKAIEITMRTPAALEAIKAVADEVEGAVVGAGTVLDAKQWEQAVTAGSKFIVSPGVGNAVLDAADQSDIPLLPGVATATEVMQVRDRGYTVLKFFPAEQAGGASYVGALASPFAGIQFCPTGGITLKNAVEYLSLPNVVCVGGSWVAPKDMIAAREWDGITKLATEAAWLRG
jgi:2-dehydro-3-deoxyphosphogluconate aldolase / (4S)-4-hydroxy-2-oxoglutarate aldolase